MKMKRLFILLLFTAATIGCSKDETNFTDNSSNNNQNQTNENNTESVSYQIRDFVWSGLNEIYLYKSEVPELADDFFSSSSDRRDFYNSYSTPEAMFKDLKASQDRFSFITDNYEELEDQFDGVSGATGIQFGVGTITGTNNIFGFIEYILPGTSAEEAGLVRGNVFTEVNGQKLTIDNILDLVSADSFTINVGTVENGTIVLSDRTVTLTDDRYTENPIYISKTFKENGENIGYLMYNSFIGDFDDELNDAFGKFKSEGVTDLILDLRYNGGGSVTTAIDLASMITGQFEGKVFMTEEWNEKYQNYYETYEPDSIVNRFDSKIRTGAPINSLNLGRVYILTTQATASASELIINGLDPYIDVVQIGDNTTGKFQASVTLYDSPDFGPTNINDSHKYALQPLVFKSVNSVGRTDYINGLTPDIEYVEDLNNMGTLGESSEPLLNKALSQILGASWSERRVESDVQTKRLNFEIIGDSKMNSPIYQNMYIERIPKIQ